MHVVFYRRLFHTFFKQLKLRRAVVSLSSMSRVIRVRVVLEMLLCRFS